MKYYCGLKMWNELLTKEEKELESFLCFKKVVYSNLLENEHELEYFWIESPHLTVWSVFGAWW